LEELLFPNLLPKSNGTAVVGDFDEESNNSNTLMQMGFLQNLDK
jgi:hypothetical protein